MNFSKKFQRPPVSEWTRYPNVRWYKTINMTRCSWFAKLHHASLDWLCLVNTQVRLLPGGLFDYLIGRKRGKVDMAKKSENDKNDEIERLVEIIKNYRKVTNVLGKGIGCITIADVPDSFFALWNETEIAGAKIAARYPDVGGNNDE